MVTHIKVDGMAFSIHAELLRKELAQTYTQKAIDFVLKKNITSPQRIKTLAICFLEKAEEEYAHRLHEDFPHPTYESYIGLTCIGSMRFFDNLRETIPAAVYNPLSQKNIKPL